MAMSIILIKIFINFKKKDKTIIVTLGNTVSSWIDYLNDNFNLKLKYFLKGLPHPSGLNVRKDIQFKK